MDAGLTDMAKMKTVCDLMAIDIAALQDTGVPLFYHAKCIGVL